jgi:DNA-binding transcriptional MocR family regulator
VALDPDELVITHGAMEALNLCLQACTRPGMWWWWSRPPSMPRCRPSSG